jgi:hypothetical protein
MLAIEDSEILLVMGEERRPPCRRGMAWRTIMRKTGNDVVWVYRLLESCLVTLVAIDILQVIVVTLMA